jgi:CO/xanthine dehydrogenase FAD-binding subunit
MLNLAKIHKPRTLEEALARLQESDTVAMAGGTGLLAEKRRAVRAVVDLSDLQLAYLERRGGDLVIGAMTVLARVADSGTLREHAGGVVAQAAHRTHASILRNQATVGGTIFSEPDGIFSVALSALDARVTLATLQSGEVKKATSSLADFFLEAPSKLKTTLLTEIVIPAVALERRAAIESVGRTPRDRAIVSVCAALELEAGIVRAGAIALGGVAERAWRARDAERELLHSGLQRDVIDRAAMAATSGLTPLGDFRGSSTYRLEMARVLTARVLGQLHAG